MPSSIAVALLSILAAGTQEPKQAAAAPEPTVTLEGRVVDLRGEPVPLASVTVVHWLEADKVLARSRCDGEGFFRIGRVPQRESWTMRATSEGRCQGEVYTTEPKPVLILLHDAATVRGVLRDRGGQPIGGVAVRAVAVGRALQRTRADARTDAEGRFELRGVPLGPVRFAAVVPGEGLAEHSAVVAGDFAIALAPGKDPTTSLQIVVEGLPEGAASRLFASILPNGPYWRAKFPPPWDRPHFDQNGRCELRPVPDLLYHVTLTAPGLVFAPRLIEVRAGAGPHVLEFRASPAGTVVSQCTARLIGPDDKPLAGVRLALGMLATVRDGEDARPYGGGVAEAISGEDGALTFASPLAAGMPFTIYSLDDRWVLDQESDRSATADARGWLLGRHRGLVNASKTSVLRAVLACSVQGRVLLADGSAAAFQSIRLQQENASGTPRWVSSAWATTDRYGNYRFARCGYLDNAVRVSVEDRAGTGASEPFALPEPGTDVSVPELRLSPPATIEGTVLDEKRQPAPGIRVWLRGWDFAAHREKSGSVVEVITDRLGRYRFVGVPPGRAWLQLGTSDDDSTGPAIEPFDVEAGKTLTFEMRVPGK